MNTKTKGQEEVPFHLSPLKLIYTAYTDERPIYNETMEAAFREIENHLSEIPVQERNCIFERFREIYMENERFAFLEGIKSGISLARELAQI